MNVLIVDDQPVNLKLLHATLVAEGHTVAQAADGVEALQILERNGADAIISDILMPRMDGYRLCSEVRKRKKFEHLPFIHYTATYTSPIDEKLSSDLGADVFMRKPAPAEEIIGALRRVTGKGHKARAISAISDSDVIKEYSERLVAKLEQKNLELARTLEELNSERLRMRHLLEHSPAIIYTLKIEGQGVTPVVVSENIERLLGVSVAESTSHDWWLKSLHPEDRDRVLAVLAKSLTKGGYSMEYRIRHKDGNYHWIEDNNRVVRDAFGEPTESVGVWTEITKRKQVEIVLVESERRFREMLENVELIAVILDKTGSITFCNDYLLKVTGCSRDEVIGANWLSIFIPEPNAAVKKIFFDTIEAGKIPTHYQNQLKTKTGELREIAWNNTMLRDAAGNIIGTASLGEDITERNRAEARVRGQEEAERANRAKSEFLSRMSHELRTPLHAILGFAQLLETEGQSPDDADSVAQILRAGNHLLGLINEVLDIARVESGKLALTPEPVSVRETLEETLSLVRSLASERRVRLEPLTGDLDCEVLSSAQRFKQVILNLLSNAVKFNREGGAVAVSCEKIQDCLRIKVADTGRGISAEGMAKLFMPFERLDVGDTLIEGVGLGLSLSKHLVEAMGGKIGVESTPGKGTTFWVELPLIQGTSAATARSLDAPIPSVAELPRCTAPRTLLYVEDNLSNLRLVERILARRPEVKLISAMQGSIGLELARQHQPDLLLLDLHLPDIQGDEILRQLRADSRTEQLPIVMISADATSAQVERLRAAGANDYLTKPIDVRRFLALVDATKPRSAQPASQQSTLTFAQPNGA